MRELSRRVRSAIPSIQLSGFLLRVHLILRAYLIKFFRTRYILRQWQVAHAYELTQTPVAMMPGVMARQAYEIAAVRRGQAGSGVTAAIPGITDRKSWQWPFLPACCSDDSEILTRRGFISVEKMRESDIFATRTEQGRFEWQGATGITRSRYRGQMVGMTGQGVDALVTPNHRMIVRKKKFWANCVTERSDEYMAYAGKMESIVSTPRKEHARVIYEIPRTAEPARSSEPVPQYIRLNSPVRNSQDRAKSQMVPTDVWVQFLSLYLAEGSCEGTCEGLDFGAGKKVFDQHRKEHTRLLQEFTTDPYAIADRHSTSPYRIRITCSEDSPIRREVAELLAKMPMAWGAGPTDFKCSSKALWFELFPLGNSYTKYVPGYVKRLNPDYLALFIDWAKKTDGHVGNEATDSGELSTVSRRLAEDMQSMLVQLGYATRMQTRPMETGATSYRIYFSHEEYTNIKEIEMLDYDGYVYCPSVPNGTICVRRNGKVFWCGNSINRLSVPILKAVPYNLRRMSRTPVPRRAMNQIKGALISLPWEIRGVEDVEVSDEDMKDQKDRIRIATRCFKHPNNDDSFQTFLEQGMEDQLCLGAYVAELGLTPDPERPIKMWPVCLESIRLFASWGEATPDMPRYAQMTGLKGERGAILFYDDELLYLKDNQATDNPFGLGKMEIGFTSINSLLGVQDMAGRAGADQVHKTWLWWEAPQTDAAYQIVRRHIQNELEGQAKISIIGGMKKPEVIDVQSVKEEDILLQWQEMLIRMIANAFDMSAMSLGVEHDVNRAVGQVLNDRDFRTAVVPAAKRLQEGFTRRILHNKLGWTDLEFVFLGLDDPDAETRIDIFSRMYAMNAITPAQIRRGMNLPKLDNPYMDLIQMEAMLVMIEAQGIQTDQLAQHTMQRQSTMADQNMQRQQHLIQQMPQQPGGNPPGKGPQGKGPQQGPPRPGGGAPPMQLPKPSPGSMSRSGMPPSPKAMALPKFPVPGTKVTAAKMVQMPLNQMQDVFYSSGMSATAFLQAVDSTEPGVLRQMTEEVKEFLEERLEEELKNKKIKPIKPQILERWRKELTTRITKDRRRSQNYTQYLYRKKPGPGDPGHRTEKSGRILPPVNRGL